MKNELTIDVKFSLSLWQCIKLRIAGNGARKYCELLFEEVARGVQDAVYEQKKNNVAPGVN